MNASDQFFAGGKGLLYPLGSEAQWVGRPRGGMIITEPRSEQERDMKNEPVFWDKERTQPKMQLVFTVVCDGSGPAAQHGWPTDERVDAQDNGQRDVYVRGKDKIEAVKAQLSQHGRPGLRVGDHYYECWTGHRQGKLGTARTWAVMLFPGAGQAQQSFFGNEQQPQQAPAAPQGFGGPPANVVTNHAQPVTNPHGFGQQPVNPTSTPAFPANPSPQGNAYGFGHQPPQSPGGQAYAAAQQGTQGFGGAPQYQQPGNPVGAAPHPGPPPQFGQQPAAAPQGFGGYPDPNAGQPMGQPQGFGGAPQQPAPAQGFGPPVPPVDDPWGQAPPVQNPYA